MLQLIPMLLAFSQSFAFGQVNQVVDSLVKSGTHSFARIDLDEMNLNLRRVRVQVTDLKEANKVFPQTAPYRVDGFFDVATRTVFIQDGARFKARSNDPSIRLFLLHEGLGAAGYNDESYSLSSVLFSLSITTPRDRSFLLRSFEDQFKNYPVFNHSVFNEFFNPRSRGGGTITVIGNGGDFDGAEIKLELLQFVRGLPTGFQLLPLLIELNVEMDDFGQVDSFVFTRTGKRNLLVSRQYWLTLDSRGKKDFFLEVIRNLL